MYNVDFLPQIEEFRRYLLGNGVVDSIDARDIFADAYGRYVPPADVVMIECHEDINGEWVPNPINPRNVNPSPEVLERKTNSI